MKKTVFEGAATAIITPMKDGKIDYEKFGELVDWQIAEGINGIIVCGTTGESATLSDAEHKDLISFAVEKVAKRVPVIAGTGSNDTEYAKSLTKHAGKAGVDAVLTVTPYYNKATQKGLIKSFTEIASVSDVPIILYNVPSRTGVNIEPATYLALSEVENIAAIKEANGNISKIVETMSLIADKLDLYSGNDDQIVPLMSIGAKGVISVLSNVLPAETVRMAKLCLEGNFAEATKMQLKYTSLINALFCEVNPIPVKTAMTLMGKCGSEMRLPLCEMTDANFETLKKNLKLHGIIR